MTALKEMRDSTVKILIVGGVLIVLAASAKTVSSINWRNSANAKKFLPLLNAAEKKYNIPANLLARQAYQESHFRDDIISGAKKSSAGALGIMQIVPAYHPTASPLNPALAIDYAAKYLRQQYDAFGSWALALAAYNAGPGNVRKYGGVPPFVETKNYVSQILADIT